MTTPRQVLLARIRRATDEQLLESMRSAELGLYAPGLGTLEGRTVHTEAVKELAIRHGLDRDASPLAAAVADGQAADVMRTLIAAKKGSN